MPDNPRRHSRLHVNMLEKYVTPIAECWWTDEDWKMDLTVWTWTLLVGLELALGDNRGVWTCSV